MLKSRIALFCLLATFGWLGPAQATTLLASPSLQSVSLGKAMQIELNISGLDTNVGLGAFDVDLTFDPSLMSFESAMFGTSLDVYGLGDIQSVTDSAGTLNLYEISLDAPADLINFQTSGFNLATLNFIALAKGSGNVDIFINALSDASGLAINAETISSKVEITSSVPEPQTYALMLVGLGLLGLKATRT